MKRIIIATVLLVTAFGLKAQNCEALVLPHFNNNADVMHSVDVAKLDIICQYARNAFYESDTIPTGAQVLPITNVKDKNNMVPMSANIIVDLNTLSYYQYNFVDLQMQYQDQWTIICFPTPASSHPYLVLRSLNEMYDRTQFPENYE